MLIVSCRCVLVACSTCILKTDQMCDLSTCMQTFEVHVHVAYTCYVVNRVCTLQVPTKRSETFLGG